MPCSLTTRASLGWIALTAINENNIFPHVHSRLVCDTLHSSSTALTAGGGNKVPQIHTPVLLEQGVCDASKTRSFCIRQLVTSTILRARFLDPGGPESCGAVLDMTPWIFVSTQSLAWLDRAQGLTLSVV